MHRTWLDIACLNMPINTVFGSMILVILNFFQEYAETITYVRVLAWRLAGHTGKAKNMT